MALKTAETSDREKVEALYERFGRIVLARLYAVCCDRDLALEATQEAFLRLQGNLATVREPAAWLVQAGRNWLRDIARRRGRMRDGSTIEFDAIAGSEFCPERAAMTAELRQQVADGLRELADDDREVLVLRYALDWPSIQIAESMGVSPAAVDMRLSRARGRMAKVLASAGVTHEVV